MGNNTSTETVKSITEKIRKNTLKEVIKIKTLNEKTSIFESKFGGIPYLPKEKEIPVNEDGKQLKLLAQFNLGDIPNNNILPNRGMLQFFVFPDDLYGMDFDNQANQEGFRVVYHSEIDSSVDEEDVISRVTNYVMDGEDLFFPIEEEYKLEFSIAEEGLSVNDYRFEKLFVEEYNKKFLNNTISKLYDLDNEDFNMLFEESDASGHKIGGYPFFTQEDPRSYKDIKEFDTLLIQIDSDYRKDTEIMWGDSGVCNFFINEEDLKNEDFNKALYNWDCY